MKFLSHFTWACFALSLLFLLGVTRSHLREEAFSAKVMFAARETAEARPPVEVGCHLLESPPAVSEASIVRFKLCNKSPKKLINEMNQFEATFLETEEGIFLTDLVRLVPGENKIRIHYSERTEEISVYRHIQVQAVAVKGERGN